MSLTKLGVKDMGKYQFNLREWSCENCHSVFYTYPDNDNATCPFCEGFEADKQGLLLVLDYKVNNGE
jgi:RNA polymerase subunit RPABC4/transcription elongation factor Spt4